MGDMQSFWWLRFLNSGMASISCCLSRGLVFFLALVSMHRVFPLFIDCFFFRAAVPLATSLKGGKGKIHDAWIAPVSRQTAPKPHFIHRVWVEADGGISKPGASCLFVLASLVVS